MQGLLIEPGLLPPECETLRNEVRAFLADALVDVPVARRNRNWSGANPAFTRKMAERGWIGMTWPRRYGGHERSMLERYVVLEEMLAAGAPVGAHWVADRQSGPLLMRYSPEVLAPRIVPHIVRGEAFFCIGMSEPDSGSDLASIRTKGTRVSDGRGDGWAINGRKVWTSGAHRAHYMIALVRTGERSANLHEGLSQFLIDMKTTPGITVRPIINQLGEHDFNEVTFDDAFVPHEHLIGTEGDGWKQVGAELAFERSGPERYLSCSQLLLEMLDVADANDPRHAEVLGRVVAQYGTLRQMSLGVAGMLSRGENPAQAAALVKDQGALLEQAMPDLAHQLFGGRVMPGSTLDQAMRYTTLAVPSFSLRGGTREILRGIIAKGLDWPMNDNTDFSTDSLIGDGAARLFAEQVDKGVRERTEKGEFETALWQRVQDGGYALLLASEASGGFAQNWRAAFPILRGIGYWQVPLPLAETMIAAQLATLAGFELPEAPLTLIEQGQGSALQLNGEHLTGEVHGVPWARFARAALLSLADGRLALLPLDAAGVTVQPHNNLAGLPADTLQLRGARVTALAVNPLPLAQPVWTLGAIARSAMMVGALESALEQAVRYAGERVQFGKPIGKNQAIQQSLALMAGDAAAARMAALVACTDASGDFAAARFSAAVAKVRAGEAATRGTSIAHQVHGAIGFTHEHPLHFATRRLWAWRDEFGTDAMWAAELGRAAIAARAGGFWTSMTRKQFA